MTPKWKMIKTLSILLLIWFHSIIKCKGAQDSSCFDNCDCCIDKQCHEGYWPNMCTKGCIAGHQGARCYNLCTYNCIWCDIDLEKCSKCYDGFYLGTNRDCKSECPLNCKTCTSDTVCTSCKEGYFNKEGSTTCQNFICPVNCECENNECVVCKNGFYDTETSCVKTCPSTCLTCSSLDMCSNCRNGFFNGHELDDNANKLLNNCTFKCRDKCTQCQSYENCLQCVDGKYGDKCLNDCAVGCKDQTCNIETGSCICSTNFIGDKCHKCVDGKYGPFCSKECPNYCTDSKCDKTTGQCEKCISGYYGTFCEYSCNKNCLYSCEISTGVCNYCFKNTFGRFCDRTCSENCKVSNSSVGSRCLSSDGTCIYGCKEGFYGLLCNQICSSLCKDIICMQESGICLKGCTHSHSDYVCSYISGNSIIVTDPESSRITTAVLATLLALAVTSWIIFIVIMIYKKMRVSQRRETEELTFPVENHTQSNEGETATSNADNFAYESIVNGRQDSDEHTYNTVNQDSRENMVNVESTNYLNLQVQTSSR